MTYSVYQHWDPLKICIVGKSYSPEFYSFITNKRVRSVMERIAYETEEDYQKLIKLLELFNVKILRPEVPDDYTLCLLTNGKIAPPPMTPRDYTAMVGDIFYRPYSTKEYYDYCKGTDWPDVMPQSPSELDILPDFVKKELQQFKILSSFQPIGWDNVWKTIPNTTIKQTGINAASTTRIGKDLYFGTETYNANITELKTKYSSMFPNYRCHIINTGGHSDGTYCPVIPGLIISLMDVPTYKNTFPDWEIIYLPGQSWNKVLPFLNLKQKNKGKWWVPGEELNDEFTNFVEFWLSHWVGYVEETVFDVNMLVIDEKNVVCNNYNKSVFQAFDRYGITPHIVNFRHRYFWDGGLHCITSDLHREGVMKDYFPERNL